MPMGIRASHPFARTSSRRQRRIFLAVLTHLDWQATLVEAVSNSNSMLRFSGNKRAGKRYKKGTPPTPTEHALTLPRRCIQFASSVIPSLVGVHSTLARANLISTFSPGALLLFGIIVLGTCMWLHRLFCSFTDCSFYLQASTDISSPNSEGASML